MWAPYQDCKSQRGLNGLRCHHFLGKSHTMTNAYYLTHVTENENENCRRKPP